MLNPMRLFRLKLTVVALTACLLFSQTADTVQRLRSRIDTYARGSAGTRDTIGGRPTGSPACERAIEWGAAKFKAIGVDAVSTEPFTVPTRWAAVSAEARCLALRNSRFV